MKYNIQALLMTNRQREATPIQNAAEEATVYIYDVIDSDWGVGAKDVISALNAAKDAPVLNIRINSPGGSVFEGRAIMEAIKRFEGKTVAHIDSLCASAATSIACACDEVVMSDAALYMIHNASGLVWGDKADMRHTADLLEKVEGSIVNDYVEKTGMEADTIISMMDQETWMTSEEALANKFVDKVVKTGKPKNTWNLAAFDKAPKQEPAQPAGFFMSVANANRLKLLD